jgi:hypothetical protein
MPGKASSLICRQGTVLQVILIAVVHHHHVKDDGAQYDDARQWVLQDTQPDGRCR